MQELWMETLPFPSNTSAVRMSSKGRIPILNCTGVDLAVPHYARSPWTQGEDLNLHLLCSPSNASTYEPDVIWSIIDEFSLCPKVNTSIGNTSTEDCEEIVHVMQFAHRLVSC